MGILSTFFYTTLIGTNLGVLIGKALTSSSFYSALEYKFSLFGF
ncbi:MAG: hypothetical protein Nk1A_7250 [Endomicrobiia bacterium]|nr:MAG: hypothetical protein Nk1A_7250 [Endomicrobiia bacterium]